jgi:multidrug efflux pump subunit AcrA (membrane-fusion protein)
VTSATNKLAADQATTADSQRIDQLAATADQANLDSAQASRAADQQRQQVDCTASAASSQCASDQQKMAQDQAAVGQAQIKVAQDQAQDQLHSDQARATITADQAALAQAQHGLAQAQATAPSPGSICTGLAVPGSVVSQGQPLWWIEGRPVPLFYGATPAFRALRPEVSGPDVQQLERDLVALGYASSGELAADGSFTAADTAAVERWQAASGMPQTGVVYLGDLVFLPGPIRVVGLHAAVGGTAQGGQPVLDYTSATKVVSVPLSPSASSQVKQGDAVTVDLPDGHTRARGAVSSVSSVATLQPQASSGAQAPTQTQNGAPGATIAVTVAFDDPSQVSALDQAPVTVDIATQSASGVLAVPVNALLALAGGGYGVEVVAADGHRQLVPVQTGIFSNSQVQVSGPRLSEGMNVVVPSS